jgi:hypothetical protein
MTSFDAKRRFLRPCEVEQLHVLQSYDILDSDDHEPEFAYITQEVKEFFACAIVVVSLVDKDRQWFKSIQDWTRKTPKNLVLFLCSRHST